MLWWGMLIDLLRGVGVKGQFLGQRGGIRLRRGKIGVRRAIGRFLMGRSRIRRGRAFRGLGLFEGVKKIR